MSADNENCPFCGNEPRYLPDKEGFYTARVICDQCEFYLPPATWSRRATVAPALTDDRIEAIVSQPKHFVAADGQDALDTVRLDFLMDQWAIVVASGLGCWLEWPQSHEVQQGTYESGRAAIDAQIAAMAAKEKE